MMKQINVKVKNDKRDENRMKVAASMRNTLENLNNMIKNGDINQSQMGMIMNKLDWIAGKIEDDFANGNY